VPSQRASEHSASQRRASGELTACSSADEAELLQPLPVRCDFQQSLHLWHRAFTTASSRRRPRASATHGDRADWGATSRSDRDGRATVARRRRRSSDGRATVAVLAPTSRRYVATESAQMRHRVGDMSPPSRRYVGAYFATTPPTKTRRLERPGFRREIRARVSPSAQELSSPEPPTKISAPYLPASPNGALRRASKRCFQCVSRSVAVASRPVADASRPRRDASFRFTERST
jgi:hypothetical protein